MTGVGVGASPVFRSSASSSSSAGGTSAGGGGSAKGTKLSVERSLLAEIVSVAVAPFLVVVVLYIVSIGVKVATVRTVFCDRCLSSVTPHRHLVPLPQPPEYSNRKLVRLHS